MKPHSAHAICHFAFLAGVALYLGTFYPTCRTLATLLVLAGAAVEVGPRIFRKPLFPELLLGACVAAAWWRWTGTTSDMYRATGMVAAYLLLIPSRIGPDRRSDSARCQSAPSRLKWLLVLVILELVWGTRLPGTELQAMIVIAIGLLALAIDSWLEDCTATQPGGPSMPNAGASLLRWAILPFLLVAAGTALIGTPIVEATAGYHASRRSFGIGEIQEDSELLDLAENMSFGDHRSLEQHPQIVARLSWESGPAPSGMVYLRALALPDLVLKGRAVAWFTRLEREPRAPVATSEPSRWAQVQRVASGSEVILRPDESNAVELPEISNDDAGNLFSTALRNRASTYWVGLDGQPLRADPALLPRYLEVDTRLNALPWSEFEDPRWQQMTPEHAANRISSRLQDDCRYDIQNLPRPADGPGGALRGFLFGPVPEARRGHCQYFATAAVLLLRRAGHPARCVSGFASDEIDPRGVTFRELHLHSWIEVVNSLGEWQRFDPSPESRLNRIRPATKPPRANANSAKAPTKENAAISPRQIHRWLGSITPRYWALLLGSVLILGALRCWRKISRETRHRDPRLLELQRRNDDLIKVASALGIAVTPATTLTDLVAALEARTHLSLGEYLRTHLAARFGQGPLPAPWPLAALAAARKEATAGL